MSVEIKFEFPDWLGEVKAHEAELNLLTAATIQANRGMLFDQEGAYNGRARWPALRLREGQILSKRGTLRKSIAPYNPNGTPGPDGVVRFSGDLIVVGTTLGYAKMMNDGTVDFPGGVLRPKNAKALKIPLPGGKSATQATRHIRSQNARGTLGTAARAERKAYGRYRNLHAKAESAGTDKAIAKAWMAQISYEKHRARGKAAQAKVDKIMSTGIGGAGFIFVKSVRIPARKFDDWNDQDQAELDATLTSKILEIMNQTTKRK